MQPAISQTDSDTIVAVATAAGKGGIGIVRLSGPRALHIGEKICGKNLPPRYAEFCQFSQDKERIDEGIALYFPGPNSFTGEDVVELQGHGGSVVLDMLTNACLSLGARMARPGEFSERAFLNDKMDLTQAEAIADIIEAGTQAAVKAASRSLEGVFSRQVENLQQHLSELRIFVEAAIDFPEEEIDFLQDKQLATRVDGLSQLLTDTLLEATRGALINEGAHIAILGRPNAGKSSLMNQLAKREIAIVTDIAGTTRDSIEQHIDLKGVPVTLVDTAGLNDTPDEVEAIGIQRSRDQAKKADLKLLVFDYSQQDGAIDKIKLQETLGSYADILDDSVPVIYVANKIDLSAQGTEFNLASDAIGISAKTGLGIETLLETISQTLGLGGSLPGFSARSRHVDALKNAKLALEQAVTNFSDTQSGEIFAEDLRLVQLHLSDITGSMSADDFLGEIFSNFCIGK